MLYVYGKPNCPSCNTTKMKLDQKGVEYVYVEEYDVAELKSKIPASHRKLPVLFDGDMQTGSYLSDEEVQHILSPCSI